MDCTESTDEASTCQGEWKLVVVRLHATFHWRMMMETFVAASSTILVGIVGYLFWLGVCQRRLSHALRAAQAQLDQQVAERREQTDVAA